ncbi:MAG: hypothetical protein WCS01_14805 [bacterium]
MKTLLGLTFALVIAGTVPVASALSEVPNFERYQVILTRLPFGAEAVIPSGPTVIIPPGPPPESFTKNIKMCAMTRHKTTGKLQVGLVDAATRKSYFLKVGEEEDGILIVEADYDGSKALLRKGGEEAWIGYTDGGGIVLAAARPGQPSGVGAPPPATMPQMASSANRASVPGMSPAGVADQAPTPPSSMISARERLAAARARRAEMGTKGAVVATGQNGTHVVMTAPDSVPPVSSGVNSMSDAEREKAEVMEQRRRLIQPSALSATDQPLEKRLQEYQKDLIRAGGMKGPPLPIPLTPESDAELVRGGFLPPQE